MVKKNFEVEEDYNKGFLVSDLFLINNVGVVTSRDGFVIDEDKKTLEDRIYSFFQLDKDHILKDYNVRENKSWKIDEVKTSALKFYSEDIISITYRPFDDRYMYYNSNFIERSRLDVMHNFMDGENVGIASCNHFKSGNTYQHILATSKIIESSFVSNKTSEITSIFPLYIYPETKGQQTIGQTTERTPNLKPEIVKEIAEKLGSTFTNEKESTPDTFAPIDILDYIYAVLHSPSYREKYKEFLKIDFPRVPYPKDQETFWRLVELGGELRQIHLLESSVVNQYITTYPVDGSNTVEKPKYADGKVGINKDQYFGGVPQVAWEFYIGGYQPAQKWLKDRKGRELSFEDILHYQKIIVALTETDRIMQEIDKIEIE